MSDARIIPVGQEPPPMAPPKVKGDTAAGEQLKPKRTRNTTDRFSVLNAFVDCSLPHLSRAEALTWLVLYRDTRNGTARTSVADIARRIGTSKRAVIDALAELRRRMLIIQLHRGGIHRGLSVYRVHPTAPDTG